MPDRRAIVIGAGITGILVARELLLEGGDVTVLEARHVGAGSSSRTAAGIRQQFSTPGTVRGMRYSVRSYQALAGELEGGESPIVQNGYLFLHADPTRWERARRIARMQQGAGLEEVEILEPDALHARFPWVARGEVVGGTYCPTDGFLRPHLIYNGGADRVRRLGGVVLQNTPVTGARATAGRLTGVQTPKGVLEADLFIDATNAWTRRLAPLLGAEPLEVRAKKRYLWFIAREGPMSAGTLSAMPLVITPRGTYCRPENPDTLLMGRKHEAAPEDGFTYEDQDQIEAAYSHQGGIDAVPFELWMGLAQILPDVGQFGGINATTSGYYAETPDHNSFLGFDRQRPNLIRLVGFSGHGAMMGPFTARVALALASAGHDLDTIKIDGDDIPLDAFRIGRATGAREQMVI